MRDKKAHNTQYATRNTQHATRTQHTSDYLSLLPQLLPHGQETQLQRMRRQHLRGVKRLHSRRQLCLWVAGLCLRFTAHKGSQTGQQLAQDAVRGVAMNG